MWSEVVWKDRSCPKWSQYEPGIAPREHLAEERSRQFTLDLKSIETKLTYLAIRVAIIIGALQLLMMPSDSIGGWLWRWLVQPFGWLRFHR
jgi:hypothetical protein